MALKVCELGYHPLPMAAADVLTVQKSTSPNPGFLVANVDDGARGTRKAWVVEANGDVGVVLLLSAAAMLDHIQSVGNWSFLATR